MSDVARRRRWWRKYAQRKRDAEMAQRRNGRERCPRRFGKYGLCGAALTYETTGNGETTVRCWACERLSLGLCCDCPNPVHGHRGKTRRCKSCKAKEKIFACRRCVQKDPARRRRMHKAAEKLWNANPENRQRKLDYKRAWRRANPDKVRAQKRREALRQSKHSHDYHAAYRAARRGERSAVAVGHDCACGAALTGRAKKCAPCKADQRRQAEAVLAERRGRGRRTDLEIGRQL